MEFKYFEFLRLKNFDLVYSVGTKIQSYFVLTMTFELLVVHCAQKQDTSSCITSLFWLLHFLILLKLCCNLIQLLLSSEAKSLLTRKSSMSQETMVNTFNNNCCTLSCQTLILLSSTLSFELYPHLYVKGFLSRSYSPFNFLLARDSRARLSSVNGSSQTQI